MNTKFILLGELSGYRGGQSRGMTMLQIALMACIAKSLASQSAKKAGR